MTSGPTALVLRALGLGDFVTGLPALSVLRRALPQHRIVLAAPLVLAPLADLAGGIDDIVPAHELDPLGSAPRGADLAIDLHGNGAESRRLLLDTEPRRLVAFEVDGVRWRADEHEVERWCRLVTEGLGLPPQPAPSVVGTLAVPRNVRAETGRTIVHCGAKDAARRWPPARFADVARRLRERGHAVVVTGGPSEKEVATAIASAADVGCSTDLSLVELAAVVAQARLVVSGDTGIAHLASAYATPSVVLFGPVSPRVWGPPAAERHQVIWHGDGSGDPHATEPDAALLAITVDEVTAAADRALSAPTLQLWS